MVIRDEPGPLEKIELWRFPVSRGNRRMFESLAAPVSRDLDRHASEIGSVSSGMIARPELDINGDFARTIPGAGAEINAQLSSLSDVDPGRMLSGALEAVNEAAGYEREAASGASSGARVPRGGSQFEAVTWQIAGQGPGAPAPRPPGGPGPAPPPADGGPGGGQPPAPPDFEQPPPPDQPAPPAPAPPDLPPGEPSPAPDDPREPLL